MEHGWGSVTPKGPHVENKYDALLPNYIDRAKTLEDDQLMVAFTNIMPEGFRQDTPTMRALNEIRAILGKRFIAMSAYQKIFPEDATMPRPMSEGIVTAKRIANARGFTFTRNTPTEAYGELFGGCVDAASNYLNGRGRFRKKTKILPELTDMALSPEWKLMRRVVGYGEFDYPRVTYPKHLRA